MFDLRPVGYFVGLLAACFGVAMAAPLAVDLFYGNEHWKTFAISGVLVFLFGTCLALSTKNSVGDGLTVKQTFLLITSVFALLPVFAAFPLVFGDINLSFTDAFFEAMSGLTTTGSTIMSGLDDMPKGILLWRGMLQWFGGISIVVVALVFLPLLRVGGMQLFRWDSYDTLGTVLHRAAETTQKISIIYLVLSLACFSAYLISGLSIFDAVVYTMTTVATGGFGNYDNSFETLGVGAEYVCVVFMILAVASVSVLPSNLTRTSQEFAFEFAGHHFFPHHFVWLRYRLFFGRSVSTMNRSNAHLGSRCLTVCRF